MMSLWAIVSSWSAYLFVNLWHHLTSVYTAITPGMNHNYDPQKPAQLITIKASLCLAISCGMIYHLTFKSAPPFLFLKTHCTSYTWPKLNFKVFFIGSNVFIDFNCIICKYVNLSYVWMMFERCIYGSAIENSICTKYVTELK